MLKSALAVFAVCLLAPGLVAFSDDQTADLADRAKGAARIVVGKVSDVHSSFARNSYGDQLIVSQVVLEITETLKGAEASALSVEIEGGTVGDLTLHVSDMPELKPGERAVFLLDQAAPGRLLPRDRGRGVLKLDDDDRVGGTNLTLPELKSMIASVKR